jgi:hypothetical protein
MTKDIVSKVLQGQTVETRLLMDKMVPRIGFRLCPLL